MARLAVPVGVIVALGMLAALARGPARTPGATAATVVPAGFVDGQVAAVGMPTSLAFVPDGRMLITAQPGQLRVFQNGALVASPALDLSALICANGERGLLGVAVDPSYTTNDSIFLFYTFNNAGTCVNRVARFVLPANSNTVSLASQTVLIDNIPSPNSNHNAGDLHFGKDGYLYASTGDGGNSDAARDQALLAGKILRIDRDGNIPPTNPFLGSDSGRCNVTGRTTAARCQETFAWGLRNPFRFAMDPNAAGTRFFINDVGQGAWEEIDLGQPGADYGWDCREGAHLNSNTGPCNPAPAGMVDPIFEYSHSTGCDSITGGAFIPNGLWPGYDNTYFFTDFICGKIMIIPASAAPGPSPTATATPCPRGGCGGGGPSPTATATSCPRGGCGGGGMAVATVPGSSDFASLDPNSVTTIAFGPCGATQALYYASYANGGEVRRITLSGAQGCGSAATATPSASATGIPSATAPTSTCPRGSCGSGTPPPPTPTPPMCPRGGC